MDCGLQTSIAIDWICRYIDKLIGQNTPLFMGGFTSKAIGEFSLLVMLMRRYDFLLNEADLARITSTCALLLDKVMDPTSFRWEETKNRQALSEIRLFLEKALSLELCTQDDYNLLLGTRINQKPLSMEQAYISGLIGVCVPPIFWRRASLKLLNAIAQNSLDRIWAYQITHLIFYATDFGSKPPEIFKENGLMFALRDILNAAIGLMLATKDWDIAIEFLLSLLFLNESAPRVEQISNEIFCLQSPDGWLISDGGGQMLREQWDQREEYSLFHTTTVAILLSIILSSNKSPLSRKLGLSYT